MLAKLVAAANSNVKRVVTKRNPKLYNLPSATVDIVSRKTRTLQSGVVVVDLKFADGRWVEVTYRDVE